MTHPVLAAGAETIGKVAEDTYVYPSSTGSSMRIAELKKGESVRILKEGGERLLVQYQRAMNAQKGWVKAADIHRVGSTLKLYPATVLSPEASANVQPARNAQRVTRYFSGERVDVISGRKEWYRVQVSMKDGSHREAWIQKADLRMGSTRKKAAAKEAIETLLPAGSRPTQKRTFDRNRADFEPETEAPAARLLLAPVFQLYRFTSADFGLGHGQIRFGAAYDIIEFLPGWVLGVPFTYALGNGFSAISGGLDVAYRWKRWRKIWFVPRGALLFERFGGNGRSFLAGTLGLGIGMKYFVTDMVALGLEPISIEFTPLTSEGVPWFMRTQILMTVSTRW